MNPHNKDEFAAAWQALDKPEEIRNQLDQDEVKEPEMASAQLQAYTLAGRDENGRQTLEYGYE